MPKLIKKSAYFIQNRVCLGTCYSHCWFDTSRRLYPEEFKLLNQFFHKQIISFHSSDNELIFSPILTQTLNRYQKRYLYKRYNLTHYHMACQSVKNVFQRSLVHGEIEFYRLAFANHGLDFIRLHKIFALMREWDIFNHLQYITE